MKNIFYIFCIFCLLYSPCFSENISKNSETNNKLTYDKYTISALDINTINNAFKNTYPVNSASQNDAQMELSSTTLPITLKSSQNSLPAQKTKNKDDSAAPVLIWPQKKEFEAEKIPKGTKFHVKSKQDISDKSKNGTKITFDSVYPTAFFANNANSKLSFKGRIIKSRKPQVGCNGGLIKIKIDKMTIGNITYPINGMVTKINDKRVLFNNIKGDSAFLTNTANAANMRNGTFHNLYQEPCTKICGDGNALITPVYLLGGAILQTSNLLISPIAALFKSGKNLEIQKNSDFIIKLEDDVFILKV